jgi:hypothetical protein
MITYPRREWELMRQDNIMIVPKYEIFAKVYHLIVIAPGSDATTLFNVII